MAEAFLRLSDRSGRPAHLLEKDVWVVWALGVLYGSPLGENLVFKGGTILIESLWRDPEIFLTYDIRALAPDLVGVDGEALPKTRSEEKRWSSEVRQRLPEWVAGTAQPIIASAGEKLWIDYQATATGSGYVAPIVML